MVQYKILYNGNSWVEEKEIPGRKNQFNFSFLDGQ